MAGMKERVQSLRDELGKPHQITEQEALRDHDLSHIHTIIFERQYVGDGHYRFLSGDFVGCSPRYLFGLWETLALYHGPARQVWIYNPQVDAVFQIHIMV